MFKIQFSFKFLQNKNYVYVVYWDYRVKVFQLDIYWVLGIFECGGLMGWLYGNFMGKVND